MTRSSLSVRLIALTCVSVALTTAACIGVGMYVHSKEFAGLPYVTMLLISGFAAALLIMLVSSWLVWQWIQPIHDLAHMCTQRDPHDGSTFPQSSLLEADDLATALNELLKKEQALHQEAASALHKQEQVLILFRRFIRQVSAELEHPLERIATQLDQQGKQHTPANKLTDCLTTLQDVQQRLRLMVALAAETAGTAHDERVRVQLDTFLQQIDDLLAAPENIIQTTAPAITCVLPATTLTRILINLAANALHQQATNIQLSAEQQDTTLCFTISDNGPGISTELAEHLRNGLRNGHIPPDQPGFGLGLPLCVALTQEIHAEMHLLETGPAGTSFAITL